MTLTQLDEYDIVDADNLTEAEHDAIGDSAPHHAKSHAISSTDHTDIAQPPVLNGFLKWDGTKFIYEVGTSSSHNIESHVDVVYNRPVENDDILKFSTQENAWVLAKESEHLPVVNYVEHLGVTVTYLGVPVEFTE